MTDALINGYYPIDYLSLPGVDSQKHPTDLWWSSKERAAVENGLVTSEYLELDFGRIRLCNYLTFDIMRKPINITVEYDAKSFDDGTHQWIEVTPLTEEKFDNVIFFNPAQNPWEHAEFYFTDPAGEIVATRFLRLKFTRQTITWPTAQIPANIWSVDVANLRTARYVSDLIDTRGYLSGVNTTDSHIDLTPLSEVRQNFTMPQGYVRANNGGLVPPRDSVITPLVPNILGFGFMAHIVDKNTAQFDWQFWDVTEDSPLLLRDGTVSGAPNTGDAWIDVYFDPRRPVATSSVSKFQFRVKSTNLYASSLLHQASPNPLGSDIYTDVEIVNQPIGQGQQIIRQNDHTLTYRIWGDIGESGRDILGNFYREGVRRDSADTVLDQNQATVWYSQPCPAATGVEALYFDVRHIGGDGDAVGSIIDAVTVDAATTGAYMHLYYSNESATGAKPERIEDWESLLWTPVNQTYVLGTHRTFDLPRPIRAAWVCMEFTNLQPILYPLPTYPELPAREYREHPTWVQDIISNAGSFNGTPAKKGDDPYVQSREIVNVDLFDLYRNHPEFVLNSRVLQQVQAQLEKKPFGGLTTNAAAGLDPFTLSQIMLNTPQMYTGNLTNDVDGNSILGRQVLAKNADSAFFSREFIYQTTPNSVVSTTTDRTTDSFAHIALEPTYFDRTCRHYYNVKKAKYNKKAYNVGVAGVRFMRKDYTVQRDDDFIHDILADPELSESPLIELNTWTIVATTTLAPNQTIYLTYRVGNQWFIDEPVTFNPANSPDIAPVLLVHGGARATDVTAWERPNQSGRQYVAGVDFDVIFDPNTGSSAIIRSQGNGRLQAFHVREIRDLGIVVGTARPSAVVINDFKVVSGLATGTASLSFIELFGHLTPQFTDISSATFFGIPTSTQIQIWADMVGTGVGVATILATELFQQRAAQNFTDVGTETGVATGTGAEVITLADLVGTATGVAAITASEIYNAAYFDTGTATGAAFASHVEATTFAVELGLAIVVATITDVQVFIPSPSTAYTDSGTAFYQPIAIAAEVTTFVPEVPIISGGRADDSNITAAELFGHIAQEYLDVATVTGGAANDSNISGVDIRVPRADVDAATVSIPASPPAPISAIDIYNLGGNTYIESFILIDITNTNETTGSITEVEIYAHTYIDAATSSGVAFSSPEEFLDVASSQDDFIEYPALQEAYTSVAPARRTPIWYPLESDVDRFPLASIRTYIDTAGSADSTVGFAIYSYDYIDINTLTATLVYKTPQVAANVTGFVTVPITNSPDFIDFTSGTTYMVGLVVDGTTIPLVKSFPAQAGLGIIAAASAGPAGPYVWPTTIDDTVVVSYTNWPYISLVSSEGALYA